MNCVAGGAYTRLVGVRHIGQIGIFSSSFIARLIKVEWPLSHWYSYTGIRVYKPFP